MELEPITRKEKIIAGQDLTPITRMEKFLKQYGGGGGGDGGGGSAATTLHINISAVNFETMEATFTADKTPTEMEQAMLTGPVWCIVTFAAGVFGEEALSFGVPPAWDFGNPAFGELTNLQHDDGGNNTFDYVVRKATNDRWIFEIDQFIG